VTRAAAPPLRPLLERLGEESPARKERRAWMRLAVAAVSVSVVTAAVFRRG
jgi:hypothetical protein